MAKISPEVRCEKLCQQPHKPRTSGHPVLVLWRTQDPRQRCKPDQGWLQGAVSRPKMAALPAEKHMANHQRADGHALSRCDVSYHMQSDDELLILIF